MMKSTQYILKKILQTKNLQYLLLLPIILGFSSCIKEDLSNCPVAFSLRIKALSVTGADITTSGDAGDVQLYIFDNNLGYIDSFTVDSADVVNLKELNLFYTSGNYNLWVVAWSNLKENQYIMPPSFSKGTNIEEALIQLRRDAEGYAVNPDDLFYGIINVRGRQSDQQIIISRKTALLSVTINGINPETGIDYYLVIEGAKKDAYNFRGNLTGNPINYKQTDGFILSPISPLITYNTIKPFRVFPVSDGSFLTIYVYKNLDIVAVTDRDVEGKPIVPIVGKTNNILINLAKQGASMDATVKVTDWNVFYQWGVW